ncbi:hypothetical protein EI555_014454 [Monodon monoceros]|uniref:Uncharacterized protein n=1 Tax=Monodon monoceros TaxID=40151 RepID=A0A4U1EM58_MONMO|nr:hypothetical protein EI555_014454 [Monodon monoceros]
MVISGGNFKPDTLKPKEVVSLLLDDEELEKKLRLRQEEKRQQEETNRVKERKRKREKYAEKVCQVWGGGQGLMGVQSGPYRRGFRVQACRLGYWLVSSSIYVCYTAVLS